VSPRDDDATDAGPAGIGPAVATAARQGLFLFERNAVVRAGAGTGKTEALATVYLHLVGGLASTVAWPRGGLGPERIVALTFTEKAAREMRERIAGAVDLLANVQLPRELEHPDAAVRRAAALRWCSRRGYSVAVSARLEALAASAVAQGRPLPPPEVWRRVAWSLGGAHIGTFHGFAAGVLRRAAVDLGIDPAFTVLDEEDADLLLRSSALKALSAAARADVSVVVELMAASGGIGERAERGLVTLVSDLVRRLEEDGLDAADLRAGVAVDPTGMRGYIASDVLRRFAEACEGVKALREDGTAEAMHGLVRVVDGLPPLDTAAHALSRMRALAALGALPSAQRTRRIEPLATEAREALASLLQDAVSVVSAHLARAGRTVLVKAQQAYREAKRARAALDFADLLRMLRDALRDRPALRREWKHRYDAVLVDEFQDTNRVQRDLVYLLRERRDLERTLAPGQSLHGHELQPSGLLVVGDAKQSIYAFRGAEVEVFLATEREVAEAGGDLVDLTDSHRALHEVVRAVNSVTATVLGAGSVRVEGLYDPARDALVAAAEGDGAARVELLTVPLGRADAQRKAEAEAIARRIADLSTPAEHPAGWRTPRMDEIAILVPSWRHLEPLKRALQARRIPYTLRGGPGFWDRREVDDLVTLLRFAADPSDRLSLAAVLRGPLVGLTDAALARLFTFTAGMEQVLDPPPAVRAGLSREDRAQLDEARPTLERLVRFGPTLGPAGVLRMALTERGYAAVLARLPFGAQRVANVDKLLGLAEAAAARGGEDGDLHGFVAHVDKMRAAAQREAEADLGGEVSGAVQILSVHAAKGLEWPVVFVAQTARRRPPRSERVLLDGRGAVVVLPGGIAAPEGFRTLRNDAHAAEDDDARRLLYVALTRARDLLVVSGPDGDGEGGWSALRDALVRQSPFGVRVVAGDAEGPAVPVRARAETGDEAPASVELAAPEPVGTEEVAPPEACAPPDDTRPEPPRRAPRRLVLAATAVQDLAWCARRFHLLHDLQLREHAASLGERAGALALVRSAVSLSDWGALRDDPSAALRRAAAASGALLDGDAARQADAMLARLARSRLARRLADDPGLVLACGLPLAARFSLPQGPLALTATADLVLRGDALGLPGAVVVQWESLPETGAQGGRGGVTATERALALCVMAWAVQHKLVGPSGEQAAVHAAVWSLGEGSPAEPVRVPGELDAVEARVATLLEALPAMRRDARWDGRDVAVCHALRCGFVPRCHG
jgi:ATP-dependent helicase/nuclease subunit A